MGVLYAFPRNRGEEWLCRAAGAFGRLDAAEMDAHRIVMRAGGRAKAKERWKAADTDGDGAISRKEADASMPGVAERFRKFDVDGNGKIERDELYHFRMRKWDRAPPSE